MKRWIAGALVVMLAAGSSGCIHVHKTERHEAGHGGRYSAPKKHHAHADDDCRDDRCDRHHAHRSYSD